MSCLGLHLALDDQQVAMLQSLGSDEERIEFVRAVLEPYFFEKAPHWKAESDKAWDAIHRSLSDGTLSPVGGAYPLNHLVLGGHQLCSARNHIISLKSPEQVRDVARALESMTKEDFSERYHLIDEEEYGYPLSDEDLEYSWFWFCVVRDIFIRTAETNRHIIFTVDQ